MHHIRQENLPFVGSSYEFVGADQAETSVSVFFIRGNPARVRVRIGILMMKSSSSVKAVGSGPSMEKLLKAARETSSSSRPARSTASK